MHEFQRRMAACEATGWPPLNTGRVKETEIFHEDDCALTGTKPALCNCDVMIYVTLKDGTRYTIAEDGTPETAS
jgi:hypothetical protein